jgi:hypothetical protein
VQHDGDVGERGRQRDDTAWIRGAPEVAAPPHAELGSITCSRTNLASSAPSSRRSHSAAIVSAAASVPSVASAAPSASASARPAWPVSRSAGSSRNSSTSRDRAHGHSCSTTADGTRRSRRRRGRAAGRGQRHERRGVLGVRAEAPLRAGSSATPRRRGHRLARCARPTAATRRRAPA